MGDRGIPRTWRHLKRLLQPTYSWVSEAGEIYWVKYHFITDQGIRLITRGWSSAALQASRH
jgi:catalase